MDENPITAAFSNAATALEIEFRPSFAIQLADETLIRSLGLLPGFGNPTGALLFDKSESPARNVRMELVKMGYFITVLYSGYEEYDREHFVDTLNDWGYFGAPETRPVWFSGKTSKATEE